MHVLESFRKNLYELRNIFPPCLQIAEAKAQTMDQCFLENGSLLYTGVSMKPADCYSKRCQILLGMGRSCRGIKIQILLPIKSSQVSRTLHA